MISAYSRRALVASIFIATSCSEPTPEPEAPSPTVVYSDRMSTWFEGAWPDVRVSESEQWAAFGTWHQLALVEVLTGQAGSGKLDGVRALAFRGDQLVRQDFERKWGGAQPDSLPDGVTPRWSPDRTSLAFQRPDETQGLTLRDRDGERTYELPGRVTAFEWSPNGDALFALSHDESGVSTLSRVDASTGARRTVARDLDAPRRAHSIGVASDASTVYLPLASPNAPDNELRHHPTVDRDLDIYAVDIATGDLEVRIATPQEEVAVAVVGNHLYWTRSLHRQSIVALPVTGGEAHLVAEGGQISYWSPEGDQVAFTVGDLRSSDSPLNFDIEVVDVDVDARPVSAGAARRALVSGYHEDFTPAWSPDGAWLAYHSHRSPTAVPMYMSEGVTDDIYLLRAGESTTQETRLTDFCWEVGMVDWSPEGRRLLFATWDKQGEPGISLPWIATLDLETGAATSFERVAFPEPLRSARMLSWSPVAEEIAIENDDDDGTQSLWVLSLDTGLAEKLVDIDCKTYCGVDWTHDGQSLIYSALVDGRMQLFNISRSGGETTQLTNDSGSILLPQVSMDGRWISATRIELTRELLRMEL